MVRSGEPEAIRVLQLQLQIEELKLKQAQLAQSARSDSEVVGKNLDFGGVKAKLPTMSPQADIITFLASWERCLQLNNVPRDKWAKLLPSCLNERASAVYATQSIADCQDYDVTRAFLFEEFKANPSVYRKRLISLRRQGTDSYKMFLSKLNDLQDHYLQSKNISSLEKLKQDNLFHLFMDSLTPDVKAFVLTREAESPADAAKYADLFYSVTVQNRERNKDARKPQFIRASNDLASDAKVGSSEAKSMQDISPISGSAVSVVKEKGACFVCGSKSIRNFSVRKIRLKLSK
jgi:hypothetical protein